MHITDLFSLEDLHREIEEGYVQIREHPTEPLRIFTYTRHAQYDNHWNKVTMTCRGLIVDHEGVVVAFPFPKIFVTAMHGVHDFAPPLPNEPFEIFDKLDGSLSIVYHYNGRWRAASKGSFISDQAVWSQGVLDGSSTRRLDTGLTYLAESIYPGNRIVVDYGQDEKLVLLAAYETATGIEAPFEQVRHSWNGIGPEVHWWGFRSDVSELEKRAEDNWTLAGLAAKGTENEGYVIRYASGVRAKIKLSAYLALHKLYTGTNERTVWEVLASGQDPGVLFDKVPDEFSEYVRKTADRLCGQHAAYVGRAWEDFTAIPGDLERKAFAERAVASEYRAALFRLYDGRDIEDLAWKAVKPRGDVPFKLDEEG